MMKNNNNEINVFEDITIDTKRLYNNFIGNTSSNLEVIKCYYLLFKIEYLVKNIGNYVILFIIISYLFFTIKFCVKGYNLLLKKINYLKSKIPLNENNKKIKKKKILKKKKKKL